MPGYGYGIAEVLTSTKSAATRGGSAFEYTAIDNNFSMEFDGVNDYINTTYNLPVDSDFTISFWVKGLTPPGGPIYPGIFPISIGVHSNGTVGRMHPSGGYKFMIQSPDESGLIATNGNRIINVDIYDGNWYHIAFKRVNSTGQLFAYANGVNVEWIGTFGASNAPSITVNASGDLYFGAPLGNTTYAWNGILDEFALWNTTLDDSTIEAIYNTTNDSDTGQVADLSETPEGAPVAWYRMGD